MMFSYILTFVRHGAQDEKTNPQEKVIQNNYFLEDRTPRIPIFQLSSLRP